MNVALRAVHDDLGTAGDLRQRWDDVIGALGPRCCDDTPVCAERIGDALRSTGTAGTAASWLGNLRTLGVIDVHGRIDTVRAEEVGSALRMVGDSFALMGPPRTWVAVATLPPEVRTVLRPPPLRQTAGVLLGLVDRSVHHLTLAAPFVDGAAVSFLRESLTAAMRRGVTVRILTSPGRGVALHPVVSDAVSDARCRLTVTELETNVSTLGSHAKVLLVDDNEAYIGSANLTSAGLGRHVEIGVELSGPQVADLVSLFAALERLGRRVFDVTEGRLLD